MVFRAKAALAPHGVTIPLPPQNKRRRGGPALTSVASQDETARSATAETESATDKGEPHTNQITVEDVAALASRLSAEPSITTTAATSDAPTPDPTPPPVAESSAAATDPVTDADGMLYCSECFVPLHPDPKPESLYIFLHALKYTTSLGTFETEMPEWTAEGWEWER